MLGDRGDQEIALSSRLRWALISSGATTEDSLTLRGHRD
jgi:hypothetical protein